MPSFFFILRVLLTTRQKNWEVNTFAKGRNGSCILFKNINVCRLILIRILKRNILRFVIITLARGVRIQCGLHSYIRVYNIK